ncbi:hypothetical protein L6R53_02895 [Myxococcota bacterium]|nr:hypothetical protein [Myxococcota bacterium]
MSSSPEGAGPLRPWPVLRALLIALVLLVHGTKALPWPDVRERDLSYGVAQDELERWAGVLGGVGIPLSAAQLSERVLDLGRASAAAQRALHGPFRPLLRLTGTGQAWGLFAYPDPYAGRLVVSSRQVQDDGQPGPWQERYRAPGQGDPWLVARLENRRIRGVYDDNGDRPKPGGFYDPFCDWVAVEIMAREPAVVEVEVRLDLVTNRVPGDRRPAVPDKRRHVRTRSRQEVARPLGLRAAAGEAAP